MFIYLDTKCQGHKSDITQSQTFELKFAEELLIFQQSIKDQQKFCRQKSCVPGKEVCPKEGKIVSQEARKSTQWPPHLKE
jgi:hypothetical protein